MRSPYAHALDVSERLNDLLIAHGGQAGEINFSAQRMLCQIAYVTELLPRETGAAHLADTEVLNGFRRQPSARGLFQASVDGGGGLGAQLLEDDGTRQHFKRGITVGQLTWPDPGNNRGKN